MTGKKGWDKEQDVLSAMAIFLLVALFIVGLLVAGIEFGRRFRLRSREQKFSSGLGVIDGAVFGLMALLLGFSFSGAVSRFDTRRELIVQETNAIGTAWLRVDLLPEAAQPQIRDDFRAYLDARLAFYQNLGAERAKAVDDLALSEKLQNKIWRESIAAATDFLACRPDPGRRFSQRNDRHHHDTFGRAADASPAAHVRDAGIARPGQLTHRRIRDGGHQQETVAAHLGLRSGAGFDHLHHHRSGVSARRDYPGRPLRCGPSEPA